MFYVFIFHNCPKFQFCCPRPFCCPKLSQTLGHNKAFKNKGFKRSKTRCPIRYCCPIFPLSKRGELGHLVHLKINIFITVITPLIKISLDTTFAKPLFMRILILHSCLGLSYRHIFIKELTQSICRL